MMFIAIMDTGRFQFVTVSESESKARANIRKAWREHMKEMLTVFPGMDMTPVSEIEDYYTVNVIQINMDGVVRDETTLIHGVA